jgi:hypothetical protein
MAPTTGKTYDEIVVVALLMSLKAKGGSLAEALKDMNALDGTRTVSGFEHSLRAVNKLAGNLNEKKARGESIDPTDMPGGSSATKDSARPTTPRKRGGKLCPLPFPSPFLYFLLLYGQEQMS